MLTALLLLALSVVASLAVGWLALSPRCALGPRVLSSSRSVTMQPARWHEGSCSAQCTCDCELPRQLEFSSRSKVANLDHPRLRLLLLYARLLCCADVPSESDSYSGFNSCSHPPQVHKSKFWIFKNFGRAPKCNGRSAVACEMRWGWI